jgi:hypothetical protein
VLELMVDEALPTLTTASDESNVGNRELVSRRLIVVVRGWPRLQLYRRIVGTSLPARRLRGRDRGLLRRKEHIVARPAQVWPAGAKTRLDATRVRHIGPAKPKRVRGTGIALLLASLGEGGCLEHNKECGRRTPVTDPMRGDHDFLLRCQITPADQGIYMRQ